MGKQAGQAHLSNISVDKERVMGKQTVQAHLSNISVDKERVTSHGETDRSGPSLKYQC